MSSLSATIHTQPLRFHALTFVDEGDNVLVGRPDIESYAAFPRDGAAALKRLVDGAAPAEVAGWYEQTYGAPLDVDDFLQTIGELEFVADAEDAVSAPVRVGLQGTARVLFSPPAYAAYAGLIALWAVLLWLHPGQAPSPRFVFFTHSLILVQCMIFFGQIPWLFLHEAGHVLAGRRIGLRSRLGFGTRLYFVVAETRIPSLLSVARRRRYPVFLAGMGVDLAAVAALGLLAYALRGAGPTAHTVAAIALAMQFPICTRFAMQFIFFLQTDVYHVAATALGCYDLHAATQAVLRNWMWQALRRPKRATPVDVWTDRDQRAARWYAPMYAIGVSVLAVVSVLALIPVVVDMCSMAASALASHVGSARFWDAAVFISLNLGQIVFFIYLSLRNRVRAQARGRLTQASAEEGVPA